MYEVVRGAFVRRAEARHAGDRVLADRGARGGVPLPPVLWALRLVVDVQQSPAERAPAVLAQQVPSSRIDPEPGATSPLYPVRAGSSGDARPATSKPRNR
jgi:hypothetical protein